jgi:hypothetical protein
MVNSAICWADSGFMLLTTSGESDERDRRTTTSLHQRDPATRARWHELGIAEHPAAHASVDLIARKALERSDAVGRHATISANSRLTCSGSTSSDNRSPMSTISSSRSISGSSSMTP